MQVDPAQLEKTFTLVEKGPVTFVAALFALTTLALLALLVKAQQTRVHQERAHKQEVKEILNAERQRAVKLELVASGFLDFIHMGALVVQKGNPKRLRPIGETLSPEAPTVSTFRAGGGDEETE